MAKRRNAVPAKNLNAVVRKEPLFFLVLSFTIIA